MSSEPCDLLQVETELDMIDGALAVELPPHMRAFAMAHAAGRLAPRAPHLLQLSSTLATARDATMHDVLSDRGLALLRLVAPLVIEADPRVAAIRAEPPSWPGLARLTSARDAVATARFGQPAIALLHRLHGVSDRGAASSATETSPIDGWHARSANLDQTAITDVWQLIATRLGVGGTLRVDRCDPRVTAQARAFVVEPGREVIVVVPHAIDTPAARFAVLHELGHAFVALAMTPGVPRVVDEAAASLVARFMEPPSFLSPRWPSDLAAPQRERRLAIATLLDGIEHRLPELPEVSEAERPATPPWALWHDPGAQAAYVAAEAMADRVRAELGPSPPRGQVLRALIAERDRIDQRSPL